LKLRFSFDGENMKADELRGRSPLEGAVMPTPQPVYLVPIASIPPNPGYTVYYYTWGNGTSLSMSTSAPSPLPDMVNNFVACVVLTNGTPPSGAVSMDGSKDGSPPPNQFSPLTDLNSFKEELEIIVKDQRAG
jgi:hypothetical protein